MADNNKQDVLVMAIFMVTRDDVLVCADELGVSQEQLTDGLIERVKDKVSQGLGDWRDAVRGMVKDIIREGTLTCPLGIECSPSCAFRKVGECALSGEVK